MAIALFLFYFVSGLFAGVALSGAIPLDFRLFFSFLCGGVAGISGFIVYALAAIAGDSDRQMEDVNKREQEHE